jgi:hypothetical protein
VSPATSPEDENRSVSQTLFSLLFFRTPDDGKSSLNLLELSITIEYLTPVGEKYIRNK